MNDKDAGEPLLQELRINRRTATSMFFAGYAVAALSANAAPIITASSGLIVEEALIPNGAPKPLPAYVVRPKEAGRHSVIIVVSEIFGIHDYIKDVCRRLAHLGYVAVAPAFFYRSGVDLPALKDIQQILPIVKQASDAQVDGDVQSLTRWLKKQSFVAPDRIGITGFCWGGAVVWRAAMIDPDIRAGVAWYGRLEPLISRASQLHAPVLGLYGGKDQGIPFTDVEAMQAALRAAHKTDSDIHIYSDAGHGFHADYRDSYNAAAAADGWRRMLGHFRAHGVA